MVKLIHCIDLAFHSNALVVQLSRQFTPAWIPATESKPLPWVEGVCAQDLWGLSGRAYPLAQQGAQDEAIGHSVLTYQSVSGRWQEIKANVVGSEEILKVPTEEAKLHYLEESVFDTRQPRSLLLFQQVLCMESCWDLSRKPPNRPTSWSMCYSSGISGHLTRQKETHKVRRTMGNPIATKQCLIKQAMVRTQPDINCYMYVTLIIRNESSVPTYESSDQFLSMGMFFCSFVNEYGGESSWESSQEPTVHLTNMLQTVS